MISYGQKKCPQLFADMRTNFTILFLNQNLHIYIIYNMCAKKFRNNTYFYFTFLRKQVSLRKICINKNFIFIKYW